MILIFFTACVISNPTDCTTVTVKPIKEISELTCNIKAQEIILEQMKNYPNHIVTRYGCERGV